MNKIAVVILTYNEESNLEGCLQSVAGWAGEIFVVDSFSTDRTLEIARRYTDKIFQHRFSGYASQRNWSLDNLPFSYEWVLYLDADERISPALRQELTTMMLDLATVDGFYIKRKLIFMGRWIKHGGYYPTWILRLFRHRAARCDERSVNEHFFVRGDTAALQQDILHEDQRDISFWTEKHNRYATLEALELGKRRPLGSGSGALNAGFWGTQAERKRWIREHIWNRLPPLLRPMGYFIYRYLIRGGFLDGTEGLIYHFLQGLWFPFLIDVKYLETKQRLNRPFNGTVPYISEKSSCKVSQGDIRRST